MEIMKDTDESADRYFNPGSTISLKCAVKREVVWDNKWDVEWGIIGYIQKKIYQVKPEVIHQDIHLILEQPRVQGVQLVPHLPPDDLLLLPV